MADQTLVQFDKDVADKVVLENNLTGKIIKFQFPPRIKTESKESEWQTAEQASFEPIKMYIQSGARTLSMEFEYIATGTGDFSVNSIVEYLRDLKEYFYRANIADFADNYPTFDLIIYNIVPSSAKFRLMNVNISYSDSLIKSGNAIFPLHTSVALSLELVTTASFDGDEKLLDVDPIQPMQTDWF